MFQILQLTKKKLKQEKYSDTENCSIFVLAFACRISALMYVATCCRSQKVITKTRQRLRILLTLKAGCILGMSVTMMIKVSFMSSIASRNL